MCTMFLPSYFGTCVRRSCLRKRLSLPIFIIKLRDEIAMISVISCCSCSLHIFVCRSVLVSGFPLSKSYLRLSATKRAVLWMNSTWSGVKSTL
jgi:hypothetical protein